MPRKISRHPYALPLLFAELAVSASETIVRRTGLIATGQCSADEYRRMIMEKAMATQESLAAAATAAPGAALEAMVTPWLDSARANAKRLRHKG